MNDVIGHSKNYRRGYATLMALVGWFAIIAQQVLHYRASDQTPGETMIRFFSFFTITTNILVAMFATAAALSKSSGTNIRGGFISDPGTASAVTLYIAVVGLIYNTVLRSLGKFEGLGWLVNELLHLVIPVMMLIYWWLWVDARRVTYRQIPSWLIYPAIYTTFIMIRGASASWYPYPFMDVIAHGYRRVFINSVFVLLTFTLLGALLIFIGKKKKVRG